MADSDAASLPPDALLPPEAAASLLPEAARRWTAAASAVGFLPMGRARTRAALEDLLRRLVPELDPQAGHAVGVRLVELRMGSPAAIGAAVTLLAEWLPRLVPGDQPRIPAVLGQLAAGASSAQRTAAVRAAETLNRAEKLHWRRVFADQQLHDPSSRLPNRSHLYAHLTERLADAPDGGRLGVALLSIGDFGRLSDAHGDALDDLLADVGTGLRELTSHYGHFTAHLGDDLFAVVATTSSLDDLVKAADEARRAIGGPLVVVDGLVEGPAAGADPHRWIRNARHALSWARQDGVDRAVFEPVRATADLRRRTTAAAIPDALANGEFGCHYQPIVDLDTGRIVGAEALARWRRAGRTLGPHEFIALAERNGSINRLGATVLEQACRQAVAWRTDGRPLVMSVNLSPYQLADPSLTASIAGILASTGLPADGLQLEITESAAVERYEHVLRDIAKLGVGIALDDFGTGFANLAALTRLPITCAKLDRRFIQDAVAGDDATLALLRHLLGLFRRFDFTVVAEGVETEAQRFLLTGLGYRLGQGFLLGRPGPASAFPELG